MTDSPAIKSRNKTSENPSIKTNKMIENLYVENKEFSNLQQKTIFITNENINQEKSSLTQKNTIHNNEGRNNNGKVNKNGKVSEIGRRKKITKFERPTKEVLEQLYSTKQLSCEKVAQELVELDPVNYPYPPSRFTVERWLHKMNIPLRSSHENSNLRYQSKKIPKYEYPAKELLEELYLTKQLGCKKIGQELARLDPVKYTQPPSRSVVERWLNELGIPILKPEKNSKYEHPTKELLEQLYITKKLGLWSIGSELARLYPEKYPQPPSNFTIKKWLVENGILLRTSYVNNNLKISTKYERPSKELLEDLYIIKQLGRRKIGQELARLDPIRYSQPPSGLTVERWLIEAGIQMRKANELIKYERPTKELLKQLYVTKQLGSRGIGKELTRLYPKKYSRPPSGKTVEKWLHQYNIETKGLRRFPIHVWYSWENLVFELAKYILSNQVWSSGQNADNKINLIMNGKQNTIRPEIIVYNAKGEIEKIIDAKLSDKALKHKDRHIYHTISKSKIVEFWILEGDSKIVVSFNDGERNTFPLNEINIYTNNKNIKRVFVFINADDLLAILMKKGYDSKLVSGFKQEISDLRNKREQFYYQHDND